MYKRQVLTYVRNSWGNDASVVDEADVARIREETRSRKKFYSPDELLAEHPFPEGSRPSLMDDAPLNPALQVELEEEPLDQLVEDALRLGDAVRGAKLFFNEKVACATCHALDYGYQLGPHLTDARSEATHAHLVESILKPSAKIRDGYQSVTVVTADGEVLSGFLVSQTDDEVVLSLPSDKGAKRTVAKDDIDELLPQEQSTMPVGLVGQLEDRQAFLDLARFVFAISEGGKAELRGLKAEAGVAP